MGVQITMTPNKENNFVMSLAFKRHCLFSAALLSLLDLCCFMICALSLVSTNPNGQKIIH